MKKTILLFHPRTMHENNYNTYWLPYSLLSIGSNISAPGYHILIIDNNELKMDSFKSFVQDVSNDCLVVGISCMIGRQISECLEFATTLKSYCPDIPVVIGGPLATMLPETTLNEAPADFVVRGQGEIPFQKLVSLFINRSDSIQDICSVSYKDSNSGTNVNNLIIKALARDRLAPFDFSLVSVPVYLRNDPSVNTSTLNYISSQGCPYDCAFCSDTNLYQKQWVALSEDRIVQDIQFLVKNYGINGIKFYDSNFFVSKQRVKKFCRLLHEQQIKIRWGAACHPGALIGFDDEFYKMLSESGCCRLLIGLESDFGQTEKTVGKNISVPDMIKIAQKCSDYNIMASFTLMVGFPGFDHDHVESTLSTGEQLRIIDTGHEVKVHIYSPFPMTRLYSSAIRQGFSPPEKLKDWADYDYYQKNTPFITPGQEQLVNEFNRLNSSAVKDSVIAV